MLPHVSDVVLDERDLDAVTAGLTLSYSSGPVEGAVNRIKVIKCQMFGRANFDLLRKRVLLATCTHTDHAECARARMACPLSGPEAAVLDLDGRLCRATCLGSPTSVPGRDGGERQ